MYVSIVGSKGSSAELFPLVEKIVTILVSKEINRFIYKRGYNSRLLNISLVCCSDLEKKIIETWSPRTTLINGGKVLISVVKIKKDSKQEDKDCFFEHPKKSRCNKRILSLFETAVLLGRGGDLLIGCKDKKGRGRGALAIKSATKVNIPWIDLKSPNLMEKLEKFTSSSFRPGYSSLDKVEKVDIKDYNNYNEVAVTLLEENDEGWDEEDEDQEIEEWEVEEEEDES